MSVHKNSKQSQNTAFLLVEIQILIGFFALTFWEKETFNYTRGPHRLCNFSLFQPFKKKSILKLEIQ